MQGDDSHLEPHMDSGSPEALLAHSSFVHSLASRLVFDRDEAEDVAQDAWVSFLRTRPDASRPLQGWFRRVVQNHALQRRRGAGRRGAREQAVARPEGLPSTEEIVERENARRAVIDALVALREPYRTTILLRFYDDLPPAKVAERLGVPLETVRTRLKRGLALLRERLDSSAGGREQWTFALLPLALPREGGAVVARELARGAERAWRAKLAALLGVVLVAFFFARWWFGADAAVAMAEFTPNEATSAVEPLAEQVAAPPFEPEPARTASVVAEPTETWHVTVLDDVARAPLVGLPVRVRIAGLEALERASDERGRIELAVPYGRSVALETSGSRLALGGRLDVAASPAKHADEPALDATALDERAAAAPVELRNPGEPRSIEWLLPAASSLVGRVVDADGLPAGGATVWLFHGLHPIVDSGAPVDPAASVVSASDGSFEFAGLPREFSVFAERGDEVTQAGLAAQLERPGHVDAIELRLAPAWRARGRVVDLRGNPLGGAQLSAANHDRRGRGRSAGHPGVSYRVLVRQRTTSDADGSFAFERLAPAQHELTAALDPYVDGTLQLVAPGDDLQFVLGSGRELAIWVIDAAGAPLRDARVRVLGTARDPRVEAAVDGSGHAYFSTDGEEGFFVRAVAPGFAVRFEGPFTAAGAVRERVTRLERAAPIRGRVLDAEGQAVPGAVVEARMPSERVEHLRELWAPKLDETLIVARVTTDASGEFVLDGTDGREYELAAYPPGATSARALARANGGASGVELAFGARSSDTLTFVGRVFDSEFGAAIDSFRVVAQRAGEQGERAVAAQTFTSSDGTFELFAGRPGPWWIWVRAEGFAPWFLSTRDYEPGEPLLACELTRALDVSMRVVDARGEPVTSARVICSSPDGRPLPTMISSGYWMNSVPADARGTAEFVGLPARPFHVEVRVPEFRELFAFDVDPATAAEGVVELRLPVDVSSPRRPLELAFVAESGAHANDDAHAPSGAPWSGRGSVRVFDAAGKVSASFAGEFGPQGFRQDKPFQYFIVSVDGGTTTSHVYQRIEHVDPAGLRDGPESLADGRLRVGLPLDAAWLEFTPEGGEPRRFALDVARDARLVLRLETR
ncbi:MAG: sigma-70 family RNA polymerase sigma factor [Planctomycetes bacterium]|nr:sigma-70 family RNA polymerase sigma factor [Planctomycetota bacterium]